MQWVENIFEAAFLQIILIGFKFVFCENMLWACTVQNCHGIFLAGRAAQDSGDTALPFVAALLLIEQFDNYMMEMEQIKSWLSLQ